MPTPLLTLSNLSCEIALVMAAVLLLSFRQSPHMRVRLYRSAFVVALAAPLLMFASASDVALVNIPVAETSQLQKTSAGGASATEIVNAQINSLSGFVISVWLVGAMGVFVRYLLSHVALAQAFCAAQPPTAAQEARLRALRAELDVKAHVQMRFSTRMRGPCAFGWVRPKILMPTSFPSNGFDALVAHELCHIRARDTLWLTIERLACTLYWFNPLIWILSRRHRDDIEVICDDSATERVVAADNYAHALINVARGMMQPLDGAGAMMTRQGLASRIRTLLERTHPLPRPGAMARTSTLVFVAASMLAMSAGQIVAASDMRAARAPAAGHGLIYVYAPPGVRIEVGTTGVCSDGGNCVFEHPLGVELLLSASSKRLGKAEWSGCTPLPSRNACRITIKEEPTRVSVRLRN